jgi:hypothetical protein
MMILRGMMKMMMMMIVHMHHAHVNAGCRMIQPQYCDAPCRSEGVQEREEDRNQAANLGLKEQR